MSTKQYLIETENDADSMDPDEYGYEDQNMDEEAFKKRIVKGRKLVTKERSIRNQKNHNILNFFRFS